MLQRCYFAQYELFSKKLLKKRENASPKLIKQFEIALSELRKHLAQNKMNMPLVKYPYDPEDETTHAYIRDIDYPAPIPNPNYKYRNVWQRIDGVKGIR
jgi:hypothetical protein